MFTPRPPPKFPLAGLDAQFLEKVITKMDAKSYVRMQQTCRGMNKVVRNCQNLCINLDGYFYLGRENNIYNIRAILCSFESLHGIRLEDLEVGQLWTGDIKELCSQLERNKITCSQLSISNEGRQLEFKKEQVLGLLETAKPFSVCISLSESNIGKNDNTMMALVEKSDQIKKLQLNVYGCQRFGWELRQAVATFEEVAIKCTYEMEDSGLMANQVFNIFQIDARKDIKSFCATVKHGNMRGDIEDEEDTRDDGHDNNRNVPDFSQSVQLVLPRFPPGHQYMETRGARDGKPFVKITYIK